jgi:hemolysin III
MNLSIKPFLRGHFHQAAFFMALGACTLLVIKSQQLVSLWATSIYSITLVSLLGISALYHRINWGPSNRMMMRRLDHAAIYFLIAGTLTPICLLALSETSGKNLLIAAWSAAGLGIILSIAFTRKPKWLNALLCVSAGIVVVPYLSEIADSLGSRNLILIICGGLAYGMGAMTYALKRPNFFPKVFGYHEVFHVLVLVGATSHFVVIHSLI